MRKAEHVFLDEQLTRPRLHFSKRHARLAWKGHIKEKLGPPTNFLGFEKEEEGGSLIMNKVFGTLLLSFAY